MVSQTALLATLGAILTSNAVRAAPTGPPIAGNYTFDDIKTQKELNWVPCYEHFTCARLAVPNDYSSPDNGQVASIPIIRLAALKKAPNGKQEMILFNPGGPGGSGVSFLKQGIRDMQQVFPNHDLISWDPRGIGLAVPSGNCADTDSHEKFMATTSLASQPDKDEESFALALALSRAQSAACAIGTGGDSGAGAHMSSSTVARDMISIQDAYDKHCGRPVGKGLVNFLGISYGTALGNYFATMFPDRVGKVALDGNVDIEDWASGQMKLSNLDIDAEVKELYKMCYETGSAMKCPLYDQAGPDAIEKKVYNFIEGLKQKPLSGATQIEGKISPWVITRNGLKAYIVGSLYNPMEWGLNVTFGLSEAIKGNSSVLAIMAKLAEKKFGPHFNEWHIGVRCTDTEPSKSDPDPKKVFEEYAITNNETYWGSVKSNTILCSGWPLEDKYKYKGKFGGETKTPILFFGNTLDPVTPLANAYSNAKRFKGAQVVKNHGLGHGALFAQSDCVMKTYHDYFATGKLPSKDIECHSKQDFFTPPMGPPPPAGGSPAGGSPAGGSPAGGSGGSPESGSPTGGGSPSGGSGGSGGYPEAGSPTGGSGGYPDTGYPASGSPTSPESGGATGTSKFANVDTRKCAKYVRKVNRYR